MTLSDQEKKLYSRVGLAIVGLIIIGFVYISGVNIFNRWNEKYLAKEKALIEMYNVKIDSLNIVNHSLDWQIAKLELVIDSLEKIDKKIIINYDKKINLINDASAYEHAEWMDSILYKLGSKVK